jgi:hypothetical protein
MFDAATLREELTAIERQLQQKPSDPDLLNRYVVYSRRLRRLEYEKDGYVTARSSVTGY